MQLFKVLNDEQLKLIRDTFEELDWKDGKGSALGAAKDIKNNWQAYPNDEKFGPISEIMQNIVFKTNVKNYMHAKHLMGLRANKYGPGQTYGWHIDMTHMQGHRTDMSFTLFLSDPDTYEGGELVLKSLGSEVKVKPKAGEMIIYNTSLLHQVNPVVSGERLGIVGWVESFVSDDDARLSIFNLSTVLNALQKNVKEEKVTDKKVVEILNQTHSQLLRKFSR